MTAYAIRPARPADLEAICALNDLAFGGPEESRIVRALEEDDASLLSLVAETPDQDVIGHIQFFPIELASIDREAVFAGLGPMSVRPDRQGSGIGSDLVRTGLDQLRSLGVHRVFVLGHTGFYPKFGFSVDATSGFAAAWGGPAFMAAELKSGGPEFGQLIYPEAFAD